MSKNPPAPPPPLPDGLDPAVRAVAEAEYVAADQAPRDAAARAAHLRRTHLAVSGLAAAGSWTSALSYQPWSALFLALAAAAGVLAFASLLWVTSPRLSGPPTGWLAAAAEAPEQTVARWRAAAADPLAAYAAATRVRAAIGRARYRLLRRATAALMAEVALVVAATVTLL